MQGNKEVMQQNNENKVTPYSIERVLLEDNIYSLKVPVMIHKDRLELLDEILKFTGEHMKTYFENALYRQIDMDIEDPQGTGMLFCERIKPIWRKNNEDNDAQCLSSSCK